LYEFMDQVVKLGELEAFELEQNGFKLVVGERCLVTTHPTFVRKPLWQHFDCSCSCDMFTQVCLDGFCTGFECTTRYECSLSVEDIRCRKLRLPHHDVVVAMTPNEHGLFIIPVTVTVVKRLPVLRRVLSDQLSLLSKKPSNGTHIRCPQLEVEVRDIASTDKDVAMVVLCDNIEWLHHLSPDLLHDPEAGSSRSPCVS
jgi:hypothetical protein